MRRRRAGTPRSLLALAALIGVCGCQSRSAILVPSVTDSATSVYDVSNVTVIHRLTSGTDVVAVRLYLLGGSRQLTAKTAGVEALLLRAAEAEGALAMALTGSRQTLETGRDWTVTGFVGLRQYFAAAWAAFARQLERPGFSDATLERVRSELLSDVRRRYTHPDLRILDAADGQLFEGHPYALDPDGTTESLTSLSRRDVEDYWDRQFVTSRMLLVVVGPVSRSTVSDLVRATIGRLPPGRYAWTPPPPVPRRLAGWMVEQQPLGTDYIVGFFAGPSPGHEDYFAFRVAVAFLSAELNRRLRGERSLSYAAGAPFVDRAIPAGGIYASTSDPAEAMRVIVDAVKDEMLLSPDRAMTGWRRSLDGFAYGELVRRLTSDGQAETLARAHVYFGDVAMADDYVRRLRRVTIAQMSHVARRYMPDVQLAFMGDTVRMLGQWLVLPRYPDP